MGDIGGELPPQALPAPLRSGDIHHENRTGHLPVGSNRTGESRRCGTRPASGSRHGGQPGLLPAASQISRRQVPCRMPRLLLLPSK